MALDGWKSNLSPDATAYLERMERKLEGLTRKISSAESTISYLTKVTNRITSGSTSSGVVQGVIPSSVNVGSGSYSVATDGTITFSGVSSISLNGVFDGLGADIYEVFAVTTKDGTAGNIYLRLRSAGVDRATGYTRATIYKYNADNTGPLGIGGAVNELGHIAPQTPAGHRAISRIMVARPAIASEITHAAFSSFQSGSFAVWEQVTNIAASANDGLTLLCSGGAASGTIKVVKIA